MIQKAINIVTIFVFGMAVVLAAMSMAGCATTIPTSELGVGVAVVEKDGKCWACYYQDECEPIDMEYCGEKPQLAEQPAEELLEPEPEPVSCNSCTLDIKQPGVMQCRLTSCDPTGKRTVQTPYLLTIGDDAIVVVGVAPAKATNP
jgi:hypothetical protein